MKIFCDNCKKEFDLRPSKIKRAKKHFCSLKCRNLFFNNKKNEKILKVRKRCECFNNIIIKDNYAVIEIKSKKYGYKYSYIDIDDVNKISNIFWHVCYMYENYFNVVGWDKIQKKEISLHRYLLNAPQGKQVDHINRNPLDNRKNNLRIVTHSENQLNKSLLKTNNSGVKGIRIRKNGKWQARIMLNKKSISIGHFNTLEEAKIAREKFCKEHNIIA